MRKLVDFRNFLLFLNRFQNEVHFTANCFSDGGYPFSRYVYVALSKEYTKTTVLCRYDRC